MSDWRPITTAPEGEIIPIEVDVWLDIPASPRSMGIADSFRVPNAYLTKGKWYHLERGEEKELYGHYITHWMPLPDPPKDLS